MFCLQFVQNGLKHSCFFLVTHKLHTAQFRTFSKADLPPPRLLALFFKTRATSKFSIARLARDSIFGVRTLRNRLAVTARLSALTRHATFVPFITASAYILSRPCTRRTVYHVVMSRHVVIKEVNSFFRIPPLRRKLSSQFNPPKTTILYSLKCSWNLISSGIPPPVDKSIPVVSSKRSTMGHILYPWRYDS